MNLKEIKELIELVAEKRLAEFEMEKGGLKLKVRCTDTLTLPLAPVATTTPLVTAVAPASSPPEMVAIAPPTEAKEELHRITAPIVGTFYRAPSPTSESFVKMGGQVQVGTVLCIIEAMKLMNEIESEVVGEIVEIYAENGQAVEYGQPLFGIRVN